MRARSALAAFVLAISASLSIAGTVAAQDRAPPTDPAAAAALFQQGRDAAKKQDFVTACARFAESYRFDPAPGTLLNLGDCNQRLGKVATAWQMFREATEHLPAEDERVAVARQRYLELEPRLPRLVIALAPGAPSGTRVVRDNVELGTASMEVALPVDPGVHAISVDAPGFVTRVISVTLVEGKTERVVVEPGAKTAAVDAPILAPSADTPPARGLGPIRTAAIVNFGIGVASIGAAITTGLILPSKEKTVEAHCDAAHTCDAIGLDAAHSGKTLATINTVTWIVGAAGIASGVSLVLLGSRMSSAPRAALSASPTPNGAAAALKGSF